MGNFEECQQYLGTLIQNTGVQAKMERNVSSVRSNGGGGGNSNSGGSGGSLVEKIKGGSYSNVQWGELTTAEKDRVEKYREEAKEKKKGKAKARSKKRSSRKRNRSVTTIPMGLRIMTRHRVTPMQVRSSDRTATLKSRGVD